MDAQRIAIDAVVILTDRDRDAVTAFDPPAVPRRREGPQVPHLQGLAGDGAGLSHKRRHAHLNHARPVRLR